jgi:hypothetical protein
MRGFGVACGCAKSAQDPVSCTYLQDSTWSSRARMAGWCRSSRSSAGTHQLRSGLPPLPLLATGEKQTTPRQWAWKWGIRGADQAD